MANETLQPHQQRVVDELRELDERCEKLHLFIYTNPVYGTLVADECIDLIDQLHAMNKYRTCLRRRAARFGVEGI